MVKLWWWRIRHRRQARQEREAYENYCAGNDPLVMWRLQLMEGSNKEE